MILVKLLDSLKQNTGELAAESRPQRDDEVEVPPCEGSANNQVLMDLEQENRMISGCLWSPITGSFSPFREEQIEKHPVTGATRSAG